MYYLIVFVGGWLLGYLASALVAYLFNHRRKVPETKSSELPGANPYAQAEADRAKYRTMWGPMEGGEGEK